MIAVPGVAPVTVPITTEATAVLPELHVPPVVASDKMIVLPEHTAPVPEIAAGNGLAVTVAVT